MRQGILLGVVCLLLGGAAIAQTQTRVTYYEYDAAGRRTKEVLEPDLAQHCQQTTYTVDGFGNRKSATLSTCAGASGHTVSSASTPRTTSVTFSANGRFATGLTNALGHAETRSHDAKFGVVTTLTGPNALATSWQYDGFGRKTRETRSDGTYTTWTYLLCTQAGASCPSSVGPGVPVWTVIEQGYTTVGGTNSPGKYQFHDKLGRVIRVMTQGFDGGLVHEDTEYDAQGLVARKSTPYAASGGSPVWTSFLYDALGRVTQKTRPDPVAAGGVATTTYGYAGPTTTTTNAKNQTKTAVTGARGQITQVTDAKGSVISYGWDAFDQLTQVNASGAITTLTYTVRGFKKAMTDASMGSWVYEYNAFGELVSQRDSLNQTTTLAYDALGRMTQRSEPDLVSNWSYDKKFDTSSCGKGIGKLCEATANNGYKRTHNYDALGRPDTTATVLDNPASPATVTETFHPQTGRIATKTWPTGFQASYAYTSLGYLQSVSAAGAGAPQTVTYTVSAMNPLGQVTQWLAGNQVVTANNYHAQTHRLMGIQATKTGQAAGNVLNHAYTWDAVGNLATRVDGNAPGSATQESFSYDSVNQLTLVTTVGGSVSPPGVVEVMYDARGNITYKSDVGRYWYDPARPNRMTQVTLETAPGAQVAYTGTRALSYAFDDTKPGAQVVNGTTLGNGNLEYTVSQDTVNSRHTVRSETYTSFNMPQQFVFGNFVSPTTSTADRTLTFVYGPEHQRIRQNVALSGTGTSAYQSGSTWYLNGIDSLGLSYEKEVTTGGMVEHKHYVSAAGQVFALYVSRSGNLGTQTATTTSYMHTDHLGSTAAITDQTGAVVERLSYDPWGKRRFPTGLPDNADSIVGQKTDRGYTMHEHLDEVGVIHMNARLYDPLVGRFMSADDVIPNPTDLKAFNRYSYVLNNPLRLTDPTGHFYDWGRSGCLTCDWTTVFVGSNANQPPPQNETRSYSQWLLEEHNIICVDCGDSAFLAEQGINVPTPQDSPVTSVSGVATAEGATSESVATGQATFGGLTQVSNSNHTYEVGPTLLCTQAASPNCTVADGLPVVDRNSLGLLTPIAGAPVQGVNILPGNNPIFHYIDEANGSIYNVTLEGHMFHSGQVEHHLYIAPIQQSTFGGSISTQGLFLVTTGTGSGNHPLFNNFIGRIIFQYTHDWSRWEMQGGIP